MQFLPVRSARLGVNRGIRRRVPSHPYVGAVAGSSGNAWNVNFNLGYTINLAVGSTYRVRCVR